MTVELTTEEMELVLLALKESVRQRRANREAADETEQLIARLEVVEREQRAPVGHGRH